MNTIEMKEPGTDPEKFCQWGSKNSDFFALVLGEGHTNILSGHTLKWCFSGGQMMIPGDSVVFLRW